MNKQIPLIVLAILLFPVKALCQIKADTSLGTESSIVLKNQSINGNTLDLIVGGKKSGSFLIHSFDKFNISKGKGALFLPNQDIQTIISRVTTQKSRLNGFLGVQGNQNLIFVNPNGIQLNGDFQSGISGAFTLSTAPKLTFGESDFLYTRNKDFSLSGQAFDTIDFEFGSFRNGEILVTDSPKTLIDNIFIGLVPVPVFSGDIPQGFTSFPKKNVNLFAGKVRFDGGIINSISGDVNIYAVSNGNLKLNSQSNIINNEVYEYGDISLTNLSNIINFSGDDSSISLLGRSVELTNGSFVTSFSANPSQSRKGIINIAAEDLFLSGFSDSSSVGINGLVRSGIFSNAEFGLGSNINISAKNAKFNNAAGILSRADNNAIGGDITINVTNELSVLGNVQAQGAFSGIGALAYTRSTGGNIKVDSSSIELTDSSSIQTYSFDQANAGNIIISAKESLTLTGVNDLSPLASQIQTYSFSNFPAGNVDVSAQEILIRDGGGIGSTARQSNTGIVTVNAQFIDLAGSIPNTVSRSRIFSSVQEQDPRVAELFVPTGVLGPDNSFLEGNAANLMVNTNILRVSDDAEISVRNDGLGDAGNLTVIASRFEVSDGAQIIASTKSGNGGNIVVDSDLLRLSNASITSSAEGLGKGGNVDITSDLALITQGGRIEANAQNNKAGTVNIEAASILTSPDTIITATSTLGPQFDGTVQINELKNQIEISDKNAPKVQPPVVVSKTCDAQNASIKNSGSGSTSESTFTDRELLAARSLKTRLAIADQYTYVNSKGETVPFKRWLGIQRTEDGSLEFVWDPKQNKRLDNLISSLDRKCT